MKIVFLPLDERPCNYNFPKYLFQNQEIELVTINRTYLGDCKKSGSYEKIKSFLLEETKDAYGLVVSIDTLVYGGIVPSRLHHDQVLTLKQRCDVLRMVKANNPSILIYAFNLIMRCPQYSLSVEEPDYYDECGREIFRKGYITHKQELKIATEQEIKELESIHIKEEYLNDYITRRKVNIEVNLYTLDLLKNKTIDFLIIPQDDASEYGYTALDQETIRKKIKDEFLMMKALMYPGADEVGLVLITRMINNFKSVKPKVYVKYPSYKTPLVIPILEDRFLDTTIRYQVLASGGLVVDSISESDIILIAYLGSDGMIPNPNGFTNRGINVLSNEVEILENIKYYIYQKPIMIADITYLNGGNNCLLRNLENMGFLFRLAAYAGWNTSSNTLGTTISQGLMYLLWGNTTIHQNFLALRYIEDVGYCANVRTEVTKIVEERKINKYNLKTNKEDIVKLVEKGLNDFKNSYDSLKPFKIKFVDLPWNRMFEVEVEVSK